MHFTSLSDCRYYGESAMSPPIIPQNRTHDSKRDSLCAYTDISVGRQPSWPSPFYLGLRSLRRRTTTRDLGTQSGTRDRSNHCGTKLPRLTPTSRRWWRYEETDQRTPQGVEFAPESNTTVFLLTQQSPLR